MTDFVARSDGLRHFSARTTGCGIGESPRSPLESKKFSFDFGWPTDHLALGLADVRRGRSGFL
jgi:hypothetical protein